MEAIVNVFVINCEKMIFKSTTKVLALPHEAGFVLLLPQFVHIFSKNSCRYEDKVVTLR